MLQTVLTSFGITLGVILTFFGISTLFKRRGGGTRPTEKVYRTCEQCRLEFYLTPIEVSFYLSHERPLPKRCRSCKAEAKPQPRVANF